MPWDPAAWNCEMFERTKAFVRLRRNNIAMRRGRQLVEAAGNEVLRITRSHPEQTVIVLANRSNVSVTVRVAKPGHDLLTGTAVPAGDAEVPRRGIVYLEQDRDR